MAVEGRARHGDRKRCSDPTGKGCRQFARRNTSTCARCGAGTRAEAKYDSEGRPTKRGLVTIPARVQALLDGTLSVEELDDEELARGYPRASDGTFRGKPSVVPTSVHQRIQRELFRRAGEQLKTNLIGAVEAMTKIATDPEVSAGDRMKAAQWVVERVMGKTPDVTVSMDEKRYEKLLETIDRSAIPLAEENDGREA